MKTRAWMIFVAIFVALPVLASADPGDKPAEQPAQQAEKAQPAEKAEPAQPGEPGEKAEPATPATPATPAASAAIKRAAFTTDVVDHEPVDELDHVPAGADQVAFFTEIVDRQGEVITHRWLLDGETVAEVPIEVGGPRWRSHSVKTLPPDATGTWSVQVVDSSGAVLVERKLGPANAEGHASHAGGDQ